MNAYIAVLYYMTLCILLLHISVHTNDVSFYWLQKE